MDLYVIVRRNGWASPEDLQAPLRARRRRATRTAPACAGSAATSSPRRAASSGPSASTRPTAPRRSAPTPRRGPARRRDRAGRRHRRRAPRSGAGRRLTAACVAAPPVWSGDASTPPGRSRRPRRNRRSTAGRGPCRGRHVDRPRHGLARAGRLRQLDRLGAARPGLGESPRARRGRRSRPGHGPRPSTTPPAATSSWP